MTYPLLLITAVAITDKLWGSQLHEHAAITAVLALGYGCSLRPGEYLITGNRQSKSKDVPASKFYLWWDRRPFAIKGPADRVSVTLDSTKIDPYGKGMPRGVSRAPGGAQFCCVAAIERYARMARLVPEQPAISVGLIGLKWTM